MNRIRAPLDAVVIGGGPSGAAISRLLAGCGHDVLLLTKEPDVCRGAESLPPSTCKVLQAVGVLDDVRRAGFLCNRGNIAYWGSADAREEHFGTDDAHGFLVDRPHLDELLLESARREGVDVRTNTIVRGVEPSAGGAAVDFTCGGDACSVVASYVIDCSGRAGVLARRIGRRYERGHRMQALVGVWESTHGAVPGHHDRTFIEAYDDGWAWSMCTSPATRYVTAMIDGVVTNRRRRSPIRQVYLDELVKTRHLPALLSGLSLQRVWARDASLYTSVRFADGPVILVGDAGAAIDPLSSFGVKKALASAWVGAVAVHTALIDGARAEAAFEFFTEREREVYDTNLALTRAHAAVAGVHFRHAFWSTRSETASSRLSNDPANDGAAIEAYQRLRSSQRLSLRRSTHLRLRERGVIRGAEIVLEAAILLRTSGTTVRFAGGVDLVALADAAPQHSDVGGLYASYCDHVAPVDLPAFLAALSLLIANGILHHTDC